MGDTFEARIYKDGINVCVDVPDSITSKLTKEKGFIYIKGTVNGFPFSKSLVPVKDSQYRLFVDLKMLKGASTQAGDIAKFLILQSKREPTVYEVPISLRDELEKRNLTEQFETLSDSRRNSVLKYLNSIKTKDTLDRNITKLIQLLESGTKNIRLP